MTRQGMQAVILCGGLGTRLGALTASTPKPLLPVGAAPFLDTLLFELGRHGFTDIVLLAGFEAAQVQSYAVDNPIARRFGQRITVSAEPERAGTAGALLHAKDLLAENFLLMNGDSWFDINLTGHFSFGRSSDALVVPALREVEDSSRYGVVELESDGRVTAFHEQPKSPSQRTVNAGIYFVRRNILDHLAPISSLEQEVLPELASQGAVRGQVLSGFFLDIGVPEAFEEAQSTVPAKRRRPAAFLDRDGVINRDHGHVGQLERFEWLDGVPAAVKHLNDKGYYVFIVTNQAGVAKGYYPESNVAMLHDHICDSLADSGAHIDDFRYCPHHVDAEIGHYRRACPWRKPAPGMLLDLMSCWEVDNGRSFVVGDQQTDMKAASAAGMKGHLLSQGNLLDLLHNLGV